MVGKFIYEIDLTVVNDIESVINPTLTNLVLGKPFVRATGMTVNESDGSILFTDGVRRVIFHDGNEEVHEYRPRLTNNTRGIDARGPCRINRRDPNNLKIPCMIGHKHFYNVYIDTGLPMNVMSLFHYNNICRWGLVYKGKDVIGQDDDMQVFVGNMMFTMGFTIIDNIEDYIDPRLSQVVFGAPFCEITNLAIDSENGIMTFTDRVKEVSFQTPYKSWEYRELGRDGLDVLDKLESQVVLSDDDVRRGCKSPFDLERGFFKGVNELSSKYRTEMWSFEDPKYLHYQSDSENDNEDDLEDVTNDGVT